MVAAGDKLMDKRVLERNMAKGLLTKEQYQRYLAELPDREAHSERVRVEPGEAEEALKTE